MAEGDSSQNQGQQPPKDEAKEVTNQPLDQKKAERAAKERERRRRRRRKKAQLKRLQTEVVPKTTELQPPTEKLQEKSVKKPSRESAPGGMPPERPVVRRSDEHTPRSKKTEPQGHPLKSVPLQEPPAVQPEEAVLEPEKVSGEPLHPLEHKTHTFAGPLLGGEEGAMQPQKPLEEHPEPESEPVPAPQPEPESEPAPVPQRAPASESVSEPAVAESEQEPERESVPKPAPIVAEPELVPAPPPRPEPRPQPLTSLEEDEEITIKTGKEAQQPKVSMEPVQDEDEDEISEVPSIFPYPQQPEPPEEVEKPEPVELEESPKKERESAEEVKKIHENRESSKETVSESEGLNQRRSMLQGAGAFSAGVIKKIGEAFHNFRLKHNVLRWAGSFLVFVLIGGGLYAGYLFKIHEKAYDFVAGFFKAPPPVEVNLDEKLLREWGIASAYLFGDNRGSNRDLLASQLFNAYFFGRLAEPKLQGETGITAAYFYGTGADIEAATNRFIAYVKNLRELVSVYDVDVYAMLDETTNREKTLSDYQAKLNEIMEKSEKMVEEISIEVDDLKVSFQSLDPEKTRFEEDFFVALQGLAGEKADFLLKSFIDVSQKQSAIKAHVAALEKLLEYYQSSMERLSIRITSIEKNREALVQGIRVVDIPGANLDIIIRENP